MIVPFRRRGEQMQQSSITLLFPKLQGVYYNKESGGRFEMACSKMIKIFFGVAMLCFGAGM